MFLIFSARKLWRKLAVLEQCRRFIIFAAVLTTLLAFAGYLVLEPGRPLGWNRTSPPVAVAPLIPSKAPLKEIVGFFAKNQTISDALARHGIPHQVILQLVESARPVYNLAKVAAARPYWIYLTPEGNLHDFRYLVDSERYLTVYRDAQHFVPVLKRLAYDTRVESVSGVIEDCLYSAVSDIGEREKLAEDLTDIFMWDIDFYTDIQKGDSFHLVVEKKWYADGRFAGYGPILAASITNKSTTFMGFRFEDESGKAEYYAPDGKALKKSFLKSPLKFTRISSRFSHARKHPILKRVQPHLGVDYAAPEGTPVRAVSVGVVKAAGKDEGSGKMVKLRHAGGYETLYMHLSHITVRLGARVSQGDIIGYVGATGLTTGPHLDFRVSSHGRFINPAKVVFPPAPPVSSALFARFASLRDRLQSQLEQIAD